MTQQLILDLNLPSQATFENFISGKNIEVVDFLNHTFCVRRESYVYLWGGKFTGKTHLLQACCHKIIAKNGTAFYLDLATQQMIKPEILIDLEQYELICLDNIDAIKNSHGWQEALFYFYNRCRDRQARLLISGNSAPINLELSLADLKSRLSWGLILHLADLDDPDKIKVLQLRAREKGIYLSDDVSNYIILHYSRDMEKLMQLLSDIDKQSLVKKRRVTIPFLKEMIL